MKRAHGKTTSTKTFKKKARTGDYQKGRGMLVNFVQPTPRELWSDILELSKTPKQELKAFDTASQTITFGAAGTFTLLNAVVNGAELYQRVGRKLYMKSLHIRGIVGPNGTNDAQDYGRIIVFYDSQPNAAVLTIATLLQDSNAAAGTSVLSEINLTNRQRFKILRDMQFQLPAFTGASPNETIIGYPDQIKQAHNIDEFVKLKGLESVYNGTNGGTIADITSGSLYIMAYSNNATWSFTFTSRLRYYD